MALKASLDIRTGWRNGRTFLESCYSTPPFKVMNITEAKQSDELHLMIMNSSPGVLSGDDYRINIQMREHTSLHLHSQSYQRLFQMKDKARQQLELVLEDDSFFCYLPHPSVPHKNSSYSSHNRIRLTGSSTLIWGEVLTPGRIGCGEIFEFNLFHSCTEIFIEEKLVVKENMLIEPGSYDMSALGAWEGFTHQASLIFLNPLAEINNIIPDILELEANRKDLVLAATALPINGILVRALGNKGEILHQILEKISRLLIQKLKTRDPIHSHKMPAQHVH